MTWNIEGIKPHQYFLSEALLSQLPDLVFLSEPQAFQCDMDPAMKSVCHEYCHWLNSEDLYDQDLPLVKSKSKGGTLAMWRKWLDPHISVHPVQSPAFLPLILQLPGALTSVHIAVYLPTSGKEYEFISELANQSRFHPCIISLEANKNLCTFLNVHCVFVFDQLMPYCEIIKFRICFTQ